MTGLGLGFTNSGGTWRKWDSTCVLVAVVLGVSGQADWARVWEGGWCYVWIICVDDSSR